MQDANGKIDFSTLYSSGSPQRLTMLALSRQIRVTLAKIFSEIHNRIPPELLTFSDAWTSILNACEKPPAGEHPLSLAYKSFNQPVRTPEDLLSRKGGLHHFIPSAKFTQTGMEGTYIALKQEMLAREAVKSTVDVVMGRSRHTPTLASAGGIKLSAVTVFFDILPDLKPADFQKRRLIKERVQGYLSPGENRKLEGLISRYNVLFNRLSRELPKSQWIQQIKGALDGFSEVEKTDIITLINLDHQGSAFTDAHYQAFMPLETQDMFAAILEYLSEENVDPSIIKQAMTDGDISGSLFAPLFSQIDAIIDKCTEDSWSILYDEPVYLLTLITTTKGTPEEIKKSTRETLTIFIEQHILPELNKRYRAWKAEIRKPDFTLIASNFSKTMPLLQLLVTQLDRICLSSSARSATYGSRSNPIPLRETMRSALPPSQIEKLEDSNPSEGVFKAVLQLLELTSREPLTRSGRRNLSNLRIEDENFGISQSLIAHAVAQAWDGFIHDIIPLDMHPSSAERSPNEDLTILCDWVIRSSVAIPDSVGTSIKLHDASAKVSSKAFFSDIDVVFNDALQESYKEAAELIVEDALDIDMTQQDKLRLLTLLTSTPPEAFHKALEEAIVAHKDAPTFSKVSDLEAKVRTILQIYNAPSSSTFSSSIEEGNYLTLPQRHKHFYEGINQAIEKIKQKMGDKLKVTLRNGSALTERAALPIITALQALWPKKQLPTDLDALATKYFKDNSPSHLTATIMFGLLYDLPDIQFPPAIRDVLETASLVGDAEKGAEIRAALKLTPGESAIIGLYFKIIYKTPLAEVMLKSFTDFPQLLKPQAKTVLINSIDIEKRITLTIPETKSNKHFHLLPDEIRRLFGQSWQNANISFISAVCSPILLNLRAAMAKKRMTLLEFSSSATAQNPALATIETHLNAHGFILQNTLSYTANMAHWVSLFEKFAISHSHRHILSSPQIMLPCVERFCKIMEYLVGTRDVYYEDREGSNALSRIAAAVSAPISFLWSLARPSPLPTPKVNADALITTRNGYAHPTLVEKELSSPVKSEQRTERSTTSTARALFS